MIKQYKDLRHIIEQSGQGIGLNELNKISYEDCKLQTGLSKTAKKLIIKHCAQYYEYKDLFFNYLRINLPAFIESKQPIRCNRQVIDDFEMKRYD